jgi:hypothetical protein
MGKALAKPLRFRCNTQGIVYVAPNAQKFDYIQLQSSAILKINNITVIFS